MSLCCFGVRVHTCICRDCWLDNDASEKGLIWERTACPNKHPSSLLALYSASRLSSRVAILLVETFLFQSLELLGALRWTCFFQQPFNAGAFRWHCFDATWNGLIVNNPTSNDFFYHGHNSLYRLISSSLSDKLAITIASTIRLTPLYLCTHTFNFDESLQCCLSFLFCSFITAESHFGNADSGDEQTHPHFVPPSPTPVCALELAWALECHRNSCAVHAFLCLSFLHLYPSPLGRCYCQHECVLLTSPSTLFASESFSLLL